MAETRSLYIFCPADIRDDTSRELWMTVGAPLTTEGLQFASYTYFGLLLAAAEFELRWGREGARGRHQKVAVPNSDVFNFWVTNLRFSHIWKWFKKEKIFLHSECLPLQPHYLKLFWSHPAHCHWGWTSPSSVIKTAWTATTELSVSMGYFPKGSAADLTAGSARRTSILGGLHFFVTKPQNTCLRGHTPTK